MIRASRHFIACTALLALSGCVSLLPEPAPAPRLFVLEADEISSQAGPTLNAVLGVSSPLGARVYLSPNMAWRSGDEIAFIAGAQWSLRADESLRALVIETANAQGRVRAAIRAGEARSDYEMRWEVRHFEIVEGERMHARFAADVFIMGANTREILASRTIESEAPLSARSASLSAQALTQAAREGATMIATFAAETIASDQTARP